MRNFIITIDGKQYQVGVEEVGATQSATPVVTSIAPAATPAPAAPTAGTKVKAPMPGSILAVKASVGQAVKAGDVLVVLEAMKMENDITAPCDGTVKEIVVTKGTTVNTDDVLVVI